MKFSEEQVKEIVALRENLMKQVDKHQEGIEMLEKNIMVLDGFLKDSSFVKASKLDTKIEPKEEEKISKSVQNSIPIKRGNDGKIIANAYVTPEQVSIILDINSKVGRSIRMVWYFQPRHLLIGPQSIWTKFDR